MLIADDSSSCSCPDFPPVQCLLGILYSLFISGSYIFADDSVILGILGLTLAIL